MLTIGIIIFCFAIAFFFFLKLHPSEVGLVVDEDSSIGNLAGTVEQSNFQIDEAANLKTHKIQNTLTIT
jgi:hypothetical protein